MGETLFSILCGEDLWHWDSNNANTITFNKNGTGEMICRHELDVWIGAEFEWKFQRAESLDQVVDLSNIAAIHTKPHLISQFDIELTLTTRRIPRFRLPAMQKWKINESLLTEDAFLPKTYTIRLEKGNFLTSYNSKLPKKGQYTPRFALRLAFDKSPYPPRHEWKEPDGAPDAMKMWEWKDFCGRQLPELKTQGSKHTFWRNCVVC